jgi:hypothetical protein
VALKKASTSRSVKQQDNFPYVLRYDSGHHIFLPAKVNAGISEIRPFIRTALHRLTPQREPQLIAGIILGIRV